MRDNSIPDHAILSDLMYECQRCEYTWKPRPSIQEGSAPKACPNCCRYDWYQREADYDYHKQMKIDNK